MALRVVDLIYLGWLELTSSWLSIDNRSTSPTICVLRPVYLVFSAIILILSDLAESPANALGSVLLPIVRGVA